MKLCKDCRHCRLVAPSPPTVNSPACVYLCDHKDSWFTNLVNGDVFAQQCSELRSNNSTFCGPSGDAWEAKKS